MITHYANIVNPLSTFHLSVRRLRKIFHSSLNGKGLRLGQVSQSGDTVSSVVVTVGTVSTCCDDDDDDADDGANSLQCESSKSSSSLHVTVTVSVTLGVSRRHSTSHGS